MGIGGVHRTYNSFRYPKCYISGKVTGTEDYEERFKRAEEQVRALGFEPINPVAVNAILPEETSWLEYMKMSIAMLTRDDCKSIFMLDGWEYSTGASIEWGLAAGANYNIFYESDIGAVEAHPKDTLNRLFGVSRR